MFFTEFMKKTDLYGFLKHSGPQHAMNFERGADDDVAGFIRSHLATPRGCSFVSLASFVLSGLLKAKQRRGQVPDGHPTEVGIYLL